MSDENLPRPNLLRLVAWLMLITVLTVAGYLVWSTYAESKRQNQVAEALPGVTEIRRTAIGRVLAIQLEEVSDAEVIQLTETNLPDLRIVYVTNSKMSTPGINALIGMAHLYELNLANTPLTEELARTLPNCTGLKKLNLTGTGVSEKTVRDLQAAMPETTIVN